METILLFTTRQLTFNGIKIFFDEINLDLVGYFDLKVIDTIYRKEAILKEDFDREIFEAGEISVVAVLGKREITITVFKTQKVNELRIYLNSLEHSQRDKFKDEIIFFLISMIFFR